MFLFNQKNVASDGQMELMEHLSELRTRLFRSIAYLVVGMGVTYGFFPFIYRVITAPIQEVLKKTNGVMQYSNISEPFMIHLQFAFIMGLVVTFPLVVLEMWGFIEPALTKEERRPIKFLAPFSLLLFLIGTLVAYASLPMAYEWMGSFAGDLAGASSLLNIKDYLLLSVKIILAFGVSFELPIVLLFLARVGIINANMMTQYWRHAVVLVSVASAIITPSADPISMLMMAVPMAILYIMSIGLVRAFEPKANGETSLSVATMILITMVPVVIMTSVSYYIWRTNPMKQTRTVSTLNTTEMVPATKDTAARPVNPPSQKPIPNAVVPPATTPTPLPENATPGEMAQRAAELAQKSAELSKQSADLAKQATELARRAVLQTKPKPLTPVREAAPPKPQGAAR